MEAIVSTNYITNISVSELNFIRETIENMNKFNQVQVLKILNKYKDVTLNENKYGIHINLSELSKEKIEELKCTEGLVPELFPLDIHWMVEIHLHGLV